MGAYATYQHKEALAGILYPRVARCEDGDCPHLLIGTGCLAALALAYYHTSGTSGTTSTVEKPAQNHSDRVTAAILGSEAELKRLYKGFDVDGDGTITLKEFAFFLEDIMGSPATPEELRVIDANGDGLVSYDEFIKHWAYHCDVMYTAADTDGDGFVSFDELRPLVPPNVPADKAESLMTKYDPDGDRKLHFPEFFLMLNEQAKFQHAEGKKKRAMTPRARRMAERKAAHAAKATHSES